MPFGATLQMLPKRAERPRKRAGRPRGSAARGVLCIGRFSGSYPMTIVTYRRQPKRKRPAKAVPAAITGPHRLRQRTWQGDQAPQRDTY
jgi:hypothetical protein